MAKHEKIKIISLRLPTDVYAQALRRENAAAARHVRCANLTAWIVQAIRDALARPDNEGR